MSSDIPPPLGERIKGLFEPAPLMTWAMSHYIRVCVEAVFQKGEILAPILATRRLRDEAFGRFWVEFSTPAQNAPPPTTTIANEEDSPQPSKNAHGSSDLIPPLLKAANGIILDIGPGTGTQMPLLRSPSITAIYGPEPCVGLHAQLARRAAAEGLADKYYILPSGAASSELLPALRETGTGVVDEYERTGKGIFDTIICVRVLCSVPEMEKTVDELYTLLKPGGKVLVTEHVVNPWRTAKGSILARIAQGVYQLLGWSFFIGDCALDRDTESVLRKVADRDGGWEVVDLERSFSWTAMPYISGTLVKKSD
ncbi:S-adenosyl-L-methionine-dependent methyltransferase [Penicillium argentinense]|uniref:S-adenosyl-L-methionine-dependent methyltransferase n=1 Tax=Penicillium argentinense TaxID=1131581 RepID=A0A9W9EWF9_9EURO|nr:S-adenosyl-L-methionine-dependent methyltransferase [Penicillium argentinense]KAJ5089179.1 S-adenosyl-L-methionine-dependent methyltransferase [Penicillium argentinense]